MPLPTRRSTHDATVLIQTKPENKEDQIASAQLDRVCRVLSYEYIWCLLLLRQPL